METLNRKGMGNFGPDSPEGDADYPLAESPPGTSSSQQGGGGNNGTSDAANAFQILQDRNNQVNNAGGKDPRKGI